MRECYITNRLLVVIVLVAVYDVGTPHPQFLPFGNRHLPGQQILNHLQPNTHGDHNTNRFQNPLEQTLRGAIGIVDKTVHNLENIANRHVAQTQPPIVTRITVKPTLSTAKNLPTTTTTHRTTKKFGGSRSNKNFISLVDIRK